MRKIAVIVLGIIILPLYAYALSGYDVAKGIDTRKEPADMKMSLTMTLTNRQGKTRASQIRSVSKGRSKKQIIWFLSPPDDKGVAFLKIEHPGRDDEMRLWLPAFNKVRLITAKAKADSFMGSDISYEDMTTRELEEYTYKLLGEEKADGRDCYVLESTPKPEINSAYSKVVSWVTKDDFSVVKEDFYDRSGTLKKKKTVKLQSIKGYTVSLEIYVEDIQKAHSTVLRFEETELDTGVGDELFQEKNLKRLPI